MVKARTFPLAALALVLVLVCLFGVASAQEAASAEPGGASLMDILRRPRWSPYVVGAGIGVVAWLAFLLCDHPLGASTAFARTAGMLEVAARGSKVKRKAYYQQHEPKVDWEVMLVIGLLIGAAGAALLSRTFEVVLVPDLWAATFGSNVAVRWVVALIGGFCVGFGARWGCGCTSGHGISGTLQLAASSWLATLCFFVGGVAAAMFIYHVL